MNWHEAFLRQARSDQAIRQRLNHPSVENSHRLHYLQMVCEKVAKAFLVRSTADDAPPAIHNIFVRFLQGLKSQRDIQLLLGYHDVKIFRRYIDSMLDLARRIEQLAPSQAGLNQPNAEYPWRDAVTGTIFAPVDYEFPLFDVGDPRMIRLERLITALLRFTS
jgi:hypothetical protein